MVHAVKRLLKIIESHLYSEINLAWEKSPYNYNAIVKELFVCHIYIFSLVLIIFKINYNKHYHALNKYEQMFIGYICLSNLNSKPFDFISSSFGIVIE